MALELLNITRANSLPGTPANSTLYFTPGANPSELSVTMVSTNGTEVRSIVTQAEVTSQINAALSGQNSAIAVADITARDALTLTASRFVMVADASDDSTVTSGGAMYFFDDAIVSPADPWTKIYEAEGMELVQSWANLLDKPTSVVADIDDAVTKRHVHANSAILDGLGENAEGDLTYGGNAIGQTLVTADW